MLIVPVTKGGTLVKELQEREEEVNKYSNERVKMIEDAGLRLKDILVDKNPFPNSKCEKKKKKKLSVIQIKKRTPKFLAIVTMLDTDWNVIHAFLRVKSRFMKAKRVVLPEFGQKNTWQILKTRDKKVCYLNIKKMTTNTRKCM